MRRTQPIAQYTIEFNQLVRYLLQKHMKFESFILHYFFWMERNTYFCGTVRQQIAISYWLAHWLHFLTP